MSSVTAAINNFGDMLKSFIGDGKKPRFDDEVLAAQSASYPTQVATSAAHAATFLGDHTTFAAINNFGDMLKSFIGDGKKPRFDDEVLAAQSASYPTQVATSAAHAATFLGDHTITQLSLQLGLALVPITWCLHLRFSRTQMKRWHILRLLLLLAVKVFSQ